MSIDNHTLIPEQIEQFWERGYLGPLIAFTPDEMAQICQVIYERVLPPFTYEAQQRPTKFRHLDSRTIYELCATPAIIGPMASLLGPDLILWHSTLFEKPPAHPTEPEAYPWHQDAYFWHEGMNTTLSAWLAITPATLENGCVEIIPGTHTREIPWIQDDDPRYSKRFWSRAADPAYFNEADKVPLILAPGQFFLFNERTLHRSNPNYTREPRLGLSIRVAVPSVKIHEEAPCLLVSGQDHFGINRYAQPPVDDRAMPSQSQANKSSLVSNQGQILTTPEATNPQLNGVLKVMEQELQAKEALIQDLVAARQRLESELTAKEAIIQQLAAVCRKRESELQAKEFFIQNLASTPWAVSLYRLLLPPHLRLFLKQLRQPSQKKS